MWNPSIDIISLTPSDAAWNKLPAEEPPSLLTQIQNLAVCPQVYSWHTERIRTIYTLFRKRVELKEFWWIISSNSVSHLSVWPNDGTLRKDVLEVLEGRIRASRGSVWDISQE